MVEAKRFAAKQMSASQWFKGAMEYDDAYGLTLSEANYSSSRSFMITMFEPMSCVFLVLAAVTAFGVATGLPMWGKE
jgi:hypothetical protein